MPLIDTNAGFGPVNSNRGTNRSPVRVYAVTSGKGGVGKTTVTVNLALATASLGRSVTILDGDLGLANVDLMLGLRPKFDLSHVMNGQCRMQDAVLTGPNGVRVIPGASGNRCMTVLSMAQYAGLMDACATLGDITDVLLIDTATGISESVVQLCAASQEVIIVACNDSTSINDAYALIRVLRHDYGLSRFHILANMARSSYEGLELLHKLVHKTERTLDIVLDLMGTVPYDPAFSALAQRGCTLVEAYPDSPAAIAFKNIARRSERWPPRVTASGKLEFFLERLIGSGIARGEHCA